MQHRISSRLSSPPAEDNGPPSRPNSSTMKRAHPSSSSLLDQMEMLSSVPSSLMENHHGGTSSAGLWNSKQQQDIARACLLQLAASAMLQHHQQGTGGTQQPGNTGSSAQQAALENLLSPMSKVARLLPTGSNSYSPPGNNNNNNNVTSALMNSLLSNEFGNSGPGSLFHLDVNKLDTASLATLAMASALSSGGGGSGTAGDIADHASGNNSNLGAILAQRAEMFGCGRGTGGPGGASLGPRDASGPPTHQQGGTASGYLSATDLAQLRSSLQNSLLCNQVNKPNNPASTETAPSSFQHNPSSLVEPSPSSGHFVTAGVAPADLSNLVPSPATEQPARFGTSPPSSMMMGLPRAAKLNHQIAPVHIDVGGKLYTSCLQTLTRFPDSRIGKLFDGRLPIVLDTMKNYYFIDRDGEAFRHILNYLRVGKVVLDSTFDEFALLMEEAEYYGLPGMKRELCHLYATKRKMLMNTNTVVTMSEASTCPSWSSHKSFGKGNHKLLLKQEETVEECQLNTSEAATTRNGSNANSPGLSQPIGKWAVLVLQEIISNTATSSDNFPASAQLRLTGQREVILGLFFSASKGAANFSVTESVTGGSSEESEETQHYRDEKRHLSNKLMGHFETSLFLITPGTSALEVVTHLLNAEMKLESVLVMKNPNHGVKSCSTNGIASQESSSVSPGRVKEYIFSGRVPAAVAE